MVHADRTIAPGPIADNDGAQFVFDATTAGHYPLCSTPPGEPSR
jgi:hypothetical protein